MIYECKYITPGDYCLWIRLCVRYHGYPCDKLRFLLKHHYHGTTETNCYGGVRFMNSNGPSQELPYTGRLKRTNRHTEIRKFTKPLLLTLLTPNNFNNRYVNGTNGICMTFSNQIVKQFYNLNRTGDLGVDHF